MEKFDSAKNQNMKRHSIPSQNTHYSHNQRLMTCKEASDFLQVKISTLYSWVHWKKIPYRKHGRLLRFCSYELMEWSKKYSN